MPARAEPAAASTIPSSRSAEISWPRGPRNGAARNPVSPVPAERSRIVWPCCGSRRSTSHCSPARSSATAARARAPSAAPSPATAGPQSEWSSASSSADGSHPPAAAFARTCSGLIAPAITEHTVGCAARPPIATSSRAQLTRRGERLECLDPIPLLVRDLEPPREARALGLRRAAVVLAGEQPLASGKYGINATPTARAPGSARPRRRARATSTCSAPSRTARARSADAASASATCAAEKFEEPMNRTFPSSTSSLIAPSVSSIGVTPSGRWYW